MKSLLVAGIAFVAALSSTITARAADAQMRAGFTPENVSVESVANYLGELQQRQNKLDFLLAPIKSENDLTRHLQDIQHSSPLDKLSPGGKQHFLASLRFNENGLVSYDYSDLRAEMTASEIYQVLSLFGAQHTATMIKDARIVDEADKLILTSPQPNSIIVRCVDEGCGGDHQGYFCSGLHTCSKALDQICMNGC